LTSERGGSNGIGLKFQALLDSQGGRLWNMFGKPSTKVIFALSLVHFTGDFYGAFLNPLLPLFVDKLSLTLTQVGLLAGISRFLAFVVQPTAGYLADHYQTRFFILGGPLLAVVFMPFIGVAPSFLVLILFVSVGSIGVSMFHPTSAGMVSRYAGSHISLCMSFFNLGGTLAFGLGPVFIAFYVYLYGLETSPLTMIPGLVVTAFLFKIVPVPVTEGLAELGFMGSIREAFGAVWKPIFLIWAIMVLRSFVGQTFITFLPIYYAGEGFSLLSIGTVVAIFSVAGAISGLLAGHLSDRLGYKPLFLFSHALATPSLYLLLVLPGNWVFVSVFLAGFFLMATLPLGVTMAQEIAPKGKSMVSSLMMGLAWGTGGMMAPLAGKLADLFSIGPVLASLAIIPLLTVGLIVMLPGRSALSPQPSLP
jgi:FSR family fosmidomycin resistance protein-like MFS transporter